LNSTSTLFTTIFGDVRETSDVILSLLDKSHDLVVIVLKSVKVNLRLVRVGHHFQVIVDVPFGMVEKFQVSWKLFLEPFVVFEVEVDDPL
jgi:hypothetical protein